MRNVAIAVVVGMGLFACVQEDAPATGTEESALTCPPPPIGQGAVIETDQTVLRNFTFGRVMDQILTSVGSTTNRTQLWLQWTATFTNNCGSTFDPHGYGLLCRPNTGNTLAGFDVSDSPGSHPHFQIVAAFNRFDLAPQNGADCGEYRLIFTVVNSGLGFIIFEGRLPNPQPALGLAGCAPVADFWATVGTTTNLTTRAAMLESFYFTGLTAGGSTFEPVVKASHYGFVTLSSSFSSAKGQIRTDFRLGGDPWFLREFHPAQGACLGGGGGSSHCATLMGQVTVKVNPGEPLFLDPSDPLVNPLAPSFQTAFLGQIPALSASSAATIGMTNTDQFNAMESQSQPGGGLNAPLPMDYDAHADSGFKATIGLHSGALTADNVLHRATTQTCAGCHALSNNICQGPGACPPGIQWPASLGFTQVALNGSTVQLSPALLTSFIPFREQVMTKFLQAACNGTALSSGNANANLGGGALDSPN